MNTARLLLQRALLRGLALVLVCFLVAPLALLLLGTGLRDFVAGLHHPLVWPALKLSLTTTTLSLLIVLGLGTPLAWCLARSERRSSRVLETLVQLPIVVPPSVAGLALLLVFGRHGVLGALWVELGSIPFSTAAVVLAEVFVCAPFFVQAATSAFRRIDPDVLLVARTLGASPLRLLLQIALPLAAPGLVTGAAMSWARALGEFGATLMFAGNLVGKTQTLPLAIYTALETDLRAAQALASVLVVVALALLAVVHVSSRLAHEPVTRAASG